MTFRDIFKKMLAINELSLFIVWVAFIFVFWLINPNYLSRMNITTIFYSVTVVGTLAVGLTCLLISGKIDLSTGSTGMMAGILIAMLLRADMPWIPAFLLVLLFGAATGTVNAFFVNGLKIAPFISTLAMSTIYGGVALLITNGANIPIRDRGFLAIEATSVWVFPLSFIIMIVLMIVYGVILSYTGFGRRIYITGGNAVAGRLAGIIPERITTILFINNGILASLVGVLFASRMHMSSYTSVVGSDLDAITAIILGGVSFTGGSGKMVGVFLGVMLITSFNTGLIQSGLDFYYQVVAKGLLLVFALILNYYRVQARLRSLKEPVRI